MEKHQKHTIAQAILMFLTVKLMFLLWVSGGFEEILNAYKGKSFPALKKSKFYVHFKLTFIFHGG